MGKNHILVLVFQVSKTLILLPIGSQSFQVWAEYKKLKRKSLIL